jgi:hypothetical protein
MTDKAHAANQKFINKLTSRASSPHLLPASSKNYLIVIDVTIGFGIMWPGCFAPTGAQIP